VYAHGPLEQRLWEGVGGKGVDGEYVEKGRE
jgi:hypothetical protein